MYKAAYFFLWLGFLDERAKLPGDGRNFTEEAELFFVKGLCFARERADHQVCHAVQHRFERIFDFACIILVAVRLHVPDDLVTEKLRYLSRFKDEPSNIAWIEFEIR
jgi:hypothetical protein